MQVYIGNRVRDITLKQNSAFQKLLSERLEENSYPDGKVPGNVVEEILAQAVEDNPSKRRMKHNEVYRALVQAFEENGNRLGDLQLHDSSDGRVVVKTKKGEIRKLTLTFQDLSKTSKR